MTTCMHQEEGEGRTNCKVGAAVLTVTTPSLVDHRHASAGTSSKTFSENRSRRGGAGGAEGVVDGFGVTGHAFETSKMAKLVYERVGLAAFTSSVVAVCLLLMEYYSDDDIYYMRPTEAAG